MTKIKIHFTAKVKSLLNYKSCSVKLNWQFSNMVEWFWDKQKRIIHIIRKSFLQIQEPIAYDDQQIVEEDGIIYKTQHDELYKSVIPEQPIQQQQQQQPTKVLPQIQPDILNQYKVQDAILPPLQYKKLIPPPETSKQYYILRRPTSLHLQHQQEPPPQQQYNNKGGQDDSVTITQSQVMCYMLP